MTRSSQADLTRTTDQSVFAPQLPARPGRSTWTGLHGDSLPLLLARAVHDYRRGPLVVIAPDMQAAELLADQYAFFAAGDAAPALIFPDWETLPYDLFSPYQDIISERLATLYRLPALERGLLIVSAPTLLGRLPPRTFIERNSLLLRRGDRLDLDGMRARLDVAGYHCVSQVMEHGEFAVRGALLDLFPMGSRAPYRIDLFDEEIETIRTFDPESQRSLEDCTEIRLLPAREFPMDEAAIRLFRQRFRATFEGDPQACSVYREVSQGIAPAGIEYYLPLFLEQTATLFDYLPAGSCVIQFDATERASAAFNAQLQERYEARRHDRERPILPPAALFLEPAELEQRLAAWPQVQVGLFKEVLLTPDSHTFNTRRPGELRLRPRSEQPAAALQSFIDGFPGRILITAESTGRRETLRDQLAGFGIRPVVVADWAAFLATDTPLALGVAPLEQGLVLDDPAVALLPEALLFGERARQVRRRKPVRDPASIVRNLTDLEINAPVVHEEHGVGRYLGLERLAVGGIENEYLALGYAGGDKLYVPVAALGW
ncbi:MAG: CarD family transcriptional regulator [Pseudomonadota bacterium]